MEVVGAVASVFSVIGFAGQLGQGVGKLYSFWNNIRDAPTSVQTIAGNLETLTELLAEIASEGQSHAPNDRLVKLLHQAQSIIDELTAVVHNLEPGFDSNRAVVRKWHALKSVLKSDKLARYEQSLASLERKLTIVLQIQNDRSNRIRFHRLEQQLITVGADVRARQLIYTTGTASIYPEPAASDSESSTQAASASESSQKSNSFSNNDESTSIGSDVFSRTILWTKQLCFDNTLALSTRLGSVHIRSQRISWHLVKPSSEPIDEDQDQYEDRTSCTFMPAPWLQNLGFKRALNAGLNRPSVGPWTPKMNIYNIVAGDASVFYLCARGNVQGVRDLLLDGKASVHDMDPEGYTLIYYAVDNAQPHMHRFLINAGAQETLLVPKSRRRERVDHPLQNTMFEWRRRAIGLDRAMNSIRTFQRHVDFEIEASGWKLLMIWAFSYDSRFDTRGTSEMDLLRMFLQLFMPEIVANINSRPCKMLLLQFLGWPAAFDCFFENVLTHNVDEVGPREEYTILQQAIASGCKYSAVLKYRPNLHVIRFDDMMSSKPETPTSLAMYNAVEFDKWRKSLEQLNVSIDQFIDEELRQSPLVNDGWTKDTLRQLFNYQIGPELTGSPKDYDTFCPVRYCAAKCGASHWWFAGTKVQPFWMLTLEFMKAGVSAKQLQEHGIPDDFEIPRGQHTNHFTNEPIKTIIMDRIVLPRDGKFGMWVKNDLRYQEWTVLVPSDSYERHDVFCMQCWLVYRKTGRVLREEQSRWEKEDAERVDAEFSPFLIHSSDNGPKASSRTKSYTREQSKYGDTDVEGAMERILSGIRTHSGALRDYF